MTNSSGMSIVTAQIRPHMEGHLIQALPDLSPFPGFTICAVRGQGRGLGAGGGVRAADPDPPCRRRAHRIPAGDPGVVRVPDDGHTCSGFPRRGDGVVHRHAPGMMSESVVRIEEQDGCLAPFETGPPARRIWRRSTRAAGLFRRGSPSRGAAECSSTIRAISAVS